MTTAAKDRVFSNIGPRISNHSREFMATVWPTANRGAEWLFASFPNLYERTLAELRGYFTKEELSAIVDATELMAFAPEMAGQTLLFCLMDEMALPTLKANYDTVDFAGLEGKVRKLRHYQRAMLELWAQAFDAQPGHVSKGDYLAKLLP